MDQRMGVESIQSIIFESQIKPKGQKIQSIRSRVDLQLFRLIMMTITILTMNKLPLMTKIDRN